MSNWKNALSRKGLALTAEWDKPCINAFAALADNSPNDFLALIWSKCLEPAELTFAAEMLGSHRVAGGRYVLRRLLLEHESALVREGAVLGLYHLGGDDFQDTIKGMLVSEPSPGLREVLRGLIRE